jgi:hypothetical protein
MIAARYKRKGKESKYVINKKLPAGLAIEEMLSQVNFLYTGITAAAAGVEKIIWLNLSFYCICGKFFKGFLNKSFSYKKYLINHFLILH